MRYSLFLFILFLLTQIAPARLYAQDSTGISYQAMVRSADGKTVTSDTVGVQISILQSSANGESVYTERHTLLTNKTGLLTLEIGSGTATDTIRSFHDIDWADGPYFVKSEMDPEGDTSYIIMGTFQLLSVPYALHARRTGRSPVAGGTDGVKIWRTLGSDTLYFGADSVMVIIPGLDSLNPPKPVNCGEATEVVEVTSATDKVWMDRNLGASRVAQSSDDSLAYGDLYQWGRFADGHQCRDSDTTSTLAATTQPNLGNSWDGKFIVSQDDPESWLITQDTSLWQGNNGKNNPCPSGFRLPTSAEWQNEINSWTNKNSQGAYESLLKLTVGGYRFSYNGVIEEVGSGGWCYSSTISGDDSFLLNFSDSHAGSTGKDVFAGGYTVRCIKN